MIQLPDVHPHAIGRDSPAYNSAMDEFRSLEPGKRKCYHIEARHSSRCNATFAAAWDAYEKGLVLLVRERMRDGSLAYMVVRRA